MKKKSKILGIIFILIGIFIPIISISKEKLEEVNYNVKLEERIKEEDYYAILEINKINLKRELYKLDDRNNHVDKNILVHESSIFPNKNKSNVILAGHSGNGSNAYFKNLYKLVVGDIVKLYYGANIYLYEIKEIEYQNKSGELLLKQDYTSMLTLITCTYKDKNTQTIYYCDLQKIENIS